jgi:ABC-type polysaccharide/polyol phosphate export permease
VKVHLVPQPQPYSSDPASDIATGIAWRACTALTLLFAALRLAAVTDWQWWLVLMPLLACTAAFALGVLFMIACAITWAVRDDG